MKHRYKVFAVTAVIVTLFFMSCSRPIVATNVDNALVELSSMDEQDIPGYLENLGRKDPIAPFYRDPSTREITLQFFTSLTQSETIARDILDNAEKFNVRPSLAFALALEESEFRVDAINRNGGSIDRGLFQLNSKSYPKLRVSDFYDPAINARYGISHLKSCLSQAGNEVAALAMYNAGNGSVERGATPQRTLNYVSRILAYEDNISSLFAAKVMASRSTAPGLARLIAQSLSIGLVTDAAERKD